MQKEEEKKNVVKMTVSGDNSETKGIAPTEMIFEPILEHGVFRFDCSVEHRKAASPSVSFKNIKDREVRVISDNVPAYTPTCVCLEEKQVVTFEVSVFSNLFYNIHFDMIQELTSISELNANL